MRFNRSICVENLDLEQLLADPLVRLVMSSDDVEEADIRRLAKDVRAHRRPAPSAPWPQDQTTSA